MSYSLGPNQRALLQIAFDDAEMSTASEGRFARAYELLFSMISNDGSGSAYISESDLVGIVGFLPIKL